MSAVTPHRRVLVWDLPVRVFHWLLVTSIAGAWMTADSERWRDVHAVLGYTALVLVGFRLVWGLVGTRYARFTALPISLAAAWAYLRSLAGRRAAHFVGHNPAGSLAIYALLATIALAGATGIAALDETAGEWVAELHEVVANALLALIGVHVLGVLAGSLAHRDNLVRAMVTGRKRGDPSSAIARTRPLVAVLLVALVLAMWTGIVPLPGLAITDPLTVVTTPARASEHARERHRD